MEESLDFPTLFFLSRVVRFSGLSRFKKSRAETLGMGLSWYQKRPSLGSPGPPAAPVFSTQLTSEDEGLKQQFEHQTIQRDSPIFESVASGSTPTTWRLRIGAQVDKAVMFCGAQHGSMDRYALMVFPICFILFASIYWTTYLSEAYIKMQK
ncbi:hypothetical protein EVAR_56841_1 [Eumeta japonica]|uniref:Uncharacterized protein n=1 Tax=Eumeta variegata TaxID=151549 RepID=A0A4C1ZD37_EUMVA|nr:hypothetical protein EVAR_56841_1 [Eumeta japonica]